MRAVVLRGGRLEVRETDDPVPGTGELPGRAPGAGHHFGAHVLVDPAEQSIYDAWTAAATERLSFTAPVIFECVGAAGLLQKLVEPAPMGTRIYAAGGWYSGDTIDVTTATRQGVSIQFGGGPHPEDWYGTLDAVCEGRLDPMPSIGEVIDLDGVPEALDRARRSEGPPRIVVRPNG